MTSNSIPRTLPALTGSSRLAASAGFLATAVSLGLVFVPPAGASTLDYEVTLCVQAGAIIGAGYVMKRFAGGRRAPSP